MAKGVKTGGRVKGSVNKKTAETQKMIEESGVTPLEFMLQIMRDAGAERADRLDAAKAAAPYVHAKLANVTVSGDSENPLDVITRIERVLVRPAN